MGLVDTLRNLFGSGGEAAPAAAAEPVAYKGYAITAAPERRESGWGTAGMIAKEFPDGAKEHRFIRADTHASRDEAAAFAIAKGQQLVDEQGDRLFDQA